VANRATLVPLLEAIFMTDDAQRWVDRCRDANIPASLVRGVLEALRSAEAQPLLARLDGFETVAHPVRMNGERFPVRMHPPKLGEHTEALTNELSDTPARTAARSRRTRTPRGRR
jgi:crotonobetainyl-CoA:carnitine CoA-transferase CaiB-like acyl-CoA transferase